MLNLFTSEVTDEYSRENFARIQEQLRQDPLFGGTWAKREYTFEQAVTELDLAHDLDFAPRDVLVLYKTGAGTFTVNYAKITDQNLNVTTTGACTVRLLIGLMGGST